MLRVFSSSFIHSVHVESNGILSVIRINYRRMWLISICNIQINCAVSFQTSSLFEYVALSRHWVVHLVSSWSLSAKFPIAHNLDRYTWLHYIRFHLKNRTRWWIPMRCCFNLYVRFQWTFSVETRRDTTQTSAGMDDQECKTGINNIHGVYIINE